MKRLILTALLTALMVSAADGTAYAEETKPAIEGCLLYHSYSSYEAGDSRISLCSLDDGVPSALEQDGFHHAMNGDFGANAYDMVFMAINTTADKWDIYRQNLFTGDIVNLTESSPYRSEDPKFSPDGYKVVFKQGYWSSESDGFVYDLAELDLKTGSIRRLTDTAEEESMPCYSHDGKSIYYSRGVREGAGIYSLDTETLESSVVCDEAGVQEYYPIASAEGLYFARWKSADDHSDCIVRIADGKETVLSLSDEGADCSDPFPDGMGGLFFSGTHNGTYDIYHFDGQAVCGLETLNTEKNELGASYYSQSEGVDVMTEAKKFLLGKSRDCPNADADGNNTIDSLDMILLRRAVSEK